MKNEEQVQALGFTDGEEFFAMVASVGLSNQERILAFEKWLEADGSR